MTRRFRFVVHNTCIFLDFAFEEYRILSVVRFFMGEFRFPAHCLRRSRRPQNNVAFGTRLGSSFFPLCGPSCFIFSCFWRTSVIGQPPRHAMTECQISFDLYGRLNKRARFLRLSVNFSMWPHPRFCRQSVKSNKLNGKWLVFNSVYFVLRRNHKIVNVSVGIITKQINSSKQISSIRRRPQIDSLNLGWGQCEMTKINEPTFSSYLPATYIFRCLPIMKQHNKNTFNASFEILLIVIIGLQFIVQFEIFSPTTCVENFLMKRYKRVNNIPNSDSYRITIQVPAFYIKITDCEQSNTWRSWTNQARDIIHRLYTRYRRSKHRSHSARHLEWCTTRARGYTLHFVEAFFSIYLFFNITRNRSLYAQSQVTISRHVFNKIFLLLN